VGGCHKEEFKGNGSFLEGFKEGGFELNGIEEEHITGFASGDLVRR